MHEAGCSGFFHLELKRGCMEYLVALNTMGAPQPQLECPLRKSAGRQGLQELLNRGVLQPKGFSYAFVNDLPIDDIQAEL